MKLYTSLVLLALTAATAFAASVAQKAVVISYPDETPQHVLDEAKEAILAAGGIITHEYSKRASRW